MCRCQSAHCSFASSFDQFNQVFEIANASALVSFLYAAIYTCHTVSHLQRPPSRSGALFDFDSHDLPAISNYFSISVLYLSEKTLRLTY